jgi:hypothetical protein
MESVIAGFFGLFMVLWGTVASIDLVQVMALHNAVAFAAQQTVRSEAVNGCWTAQTNAIALDTLTQQGVPSGTVTLTAYDTGPGAPYGSAVSVGFRVTDRLEFLGATTPLTVTIAVQDTATSQWVPTVDATSNGACATPSGLAVASGAAQTTSGGGPYNGA